MGMLHQIIASMDAHTAIYTVNQRLAAQLLKLFNQTQQKKNLITWATPTILPIQTALYQLWMQCHYGTTWLLPDYCEMHLWRKIISQNGHDDLIDPYATAALAQQAWRLIHEWSVCIDVLKQNKNDDVNLFIQWTQQFKQICEKQNMISHVESYDQLIQMLPNHPHLLAKKILLVGFDEIVPVIKKWISTASRWCEIEIVTIYKNINTEIQRIHPYTANDEIELMAHWAYQQYLQNPRSEIGCIIPNLNSTRDRIERIFTEVCSVENLFAGTTQGEHIFNISAGRSFASYPIIQDALQILSWGKNEIDVRTSYRWLKSPYCALNEIDMISGACVDVKLREQNENPLALTTVRDIFQELIVHFPQMTWLKRWLQFMKHIPEISTQLLPSEWIKKFEQWLDDLQWPGGRQINSLEYQLINRWQQSLCELIILDDIIGKVFFAEMYTLVLRYCQSIVFQPQGSDAPIQILGILESAAMSFDNLWIMGLDNQTWPPPASPNPFLPVSLQRELNMPHASPQRQYQYAQQILQRLFSSSKNIYCSSPQKRDDQKLQPSALIEVFREIEMDKNIFHQPLLIDTIAYQTDWMVREEEIIPLKKGEIVHGGSMILELQSLCPFRAFAQIRLNAMPLPETTLTWISRERGIWVHDILYQFWTKIQTQQNLRTMSSDQCDFLLNQLIQSTVENLRPESNIKKFIYKLEQQRLFLLLKKWLDYEKQRQPFTVLTCEQTKQIELNGLTLKIRMDRIDQNDKGQQLIIDYKTGPVTIKHWFSDRIQQLQLPLYYLTSNHSLIHGIAFAKVNLSDIGFQGIIKDENDKQLFSDLTTLNDCYYAENFSSWKSLQYFWESKIDALSLAFQKGEIRVDPVTQACEYCHLHQLCRIND